ncbi:MAG: phosphoribosylamine--glycine ligase [Actinomycetota bacterium]
MRTLVLGSGGRESALAWGLARSKEVSEVIAAPGNPGIASFASVEPIDPERADSVVDLARHLDAGLVVIGPEAPLVGGVADALRADGRAVFGPGGGAARIEGSKSYAKKLMLEAGIPTARGRSFSSVEPAIEFMDELGPPYVVKADGLAAGKGVTVTETRADAVSAIQECLVGGRFGEAGRTVVIEEFLDGEEASLIAFTDGHAVVACEPAQDYKRVYDDDEGPNTGGMGSYSPVPSCPADVAARIAEEIIEPMVWATAAAGAPFVGALYAGLALTGDGPKVVEFNARFGDPETQALVPRLRSDLGALCRAGAVGELAGATARWTPEPCVSVVLASGGYPGAHATGVPIEGVAEAERLPGVVVFHAGTATKDGALVTAGGRVLAVSALGTTYSEARERAYEAASRIQFEGKHLRSDIGLRAELSEEARL